MLTSILWPLQELLNKAFLPADYTFSIVGGGVTLPWVTLGMVGGMMGLGYADVFAGVVQSEVRGILCSLLLLKVLSLFFRRFLVF